MERGGLYYQISKLQIKKYGVHIFEITPPLPASKERTLALFGPITSICTPLSPQRVNAFLG